MCVRIYILTYINNYFGYYLTTIWYISTDNQLVMMVVIELENDYYTTTT